MLTACQSRQALICLVTVQFWFHTFYILQWKMNAEFHDCSHENKAEDVNDVNQSLIFNTFQLQYEVIKMMTVNLAK